MKGKILLLGAMALAFQFTNANDHANIKKTSETITVDGSNSEHVWSVANKYVLQHKNSTTKPSSDTDLSGYWQAAWNDNGIYIYVDITDDILNNDPALANWQTDAIQFWLFAFTSKSIYSAPYNQCNDANQHGLKNIWMWRPENFQGTVNRGRYTDASRTNYSSGPSYDCNQQLNRNWVTFSAKGIEKTSVPKGWAFEAYLPWKAMQVGTDLTITSIKPVVGDSLIFEIGAIDNDGVVTQVKKRYWALPDNIGDAWSAADVCGRINLIAEDPSAVYEVKKDLFQLYPNPANDYINISHEGIISSVEVYDVTGKECVQVKNVMNTNLKLTTANLHYGLYSVKVTDTNGNQQSHLFVKK